MLAKLCASVALVFGIGLVPFGILIGPSLLPMPAGPDGREPYRKYDIRVIVWAVPGMILAKIGAAKLFE